jgi:motility quorum-sensing regulator/GCU-specific mRNA interferase toxin
VTLALDCRRIHDALTGTSKVPCPARCVEKRKPHYRLDTIKATFVSVRVLRITKTATTCAEALGISLEGVVNVIQGMTREQFYKSMTSNANSALWQDVYHVPHDTIILYVKFTTDAEGHLVISFKEK